MPLFDYTGQLQTGSTFHGTLEAETQQHAEAILADMGVRTTSLRPARRLAYVAPLSLDDFLFFNEQLAAMTKAGIPLQEGLRQLAADVGSRKLKRLLLDLADDLAAGTPLEQAVAKQQRRFPTHYAGVIEAGLKTGDLGGTLYGVTAHLRLKSSVRRALIELAIYPLVILSFALVILSFVMRVVVPQVQAVVLDMLGPGESVLGGFGRAPRSPPISMGLAEFIFGLAYAWPVIEIVLVLLLVGACVLFLATYLPGGRPLREWILRHIPGIAQIYWSSVLARFTHTSALAAHAGTPLPELIQTGGAASGSPALMAATQRIAQALETGDSLENAARQERDVPALWTCVVSTTAARGDLPAALSELARTCETRAEHWVRTMRIILGPILLLLVAGVLGFVIVGLGTAFTRMLQYMTG